MFDALDVNGDGVLDPLEIINGLKNRFGIFFSDEEMANMLQFIDSDFSGDIDFKEFSSKISMGNTILNKLNHNLKIDSSNVSISYVFYLTLHSKILLHRLSSQ